MWRSVAAVVYVQYVSGQPASNLTAVLNGLGQATGRRLQAGSSSGGLRADPVLIDLSSRTTIMVICQLAQLMLSGAPMLASPGTNAEASSSSGVAALPAPIQQSAVASISAAATVALSSVAAQDANLLLRSSIVSQGYLCGLINDLATSQVSAEVFQQKTSPEVSEGSIGGS